MPAGAATIAGQELAAGASALVQGFCGDPSTGGSVTFSASGTLGGGSVNLGGSAVVNGAGEVTGLSATLTVVGTTPDIALRRDYADRHGAGRDERLVHRRRHPHVVGD